MNLDRLVLILLSAVLTFTLRAFPFLIFNKKFSKREELPKRVAYVGDMLPMAIMATLVVYCMKDITTSRIPEEIFSSVLPMIGGVALTTVVHLWKKNTILSITLGTLAYMIFIRL